MEFSKRMVEEQLNHVSGDRRLDGTDIIQTIEGYKDFVQLIKVCDDSKWRWKEIKNILPKQKKISSNQQFGIWPGDVELLTVEWGVIIVVA